MKKFLCALMIVALMAGVSFGTSNSELKRMSVFISNFVEVGMNDIDIHHTSAENETLGYYDGKYYHFDASDGDNEQARVFEAQKREHLIIMKGETYYPDNEDLERYSFTARAKPYKYGGKNTWSIITLHIERDYE